MPYFKQHNIVILGFDGVLASALTGALDLFSFSGVSFQRFVNQQIEPRFKVSIASLYGSSFICSNQLKIHAHIDIADVQNCDILLVPTIGDSIDKVLLQSRPLYSHIKRLAKNNSDIASNCSGAFLLAECGLLDQRTATTHWGYAERFKRDYPKVLLNPDMLVSQSDNVFCAAGGSAFYDLGLLLIERYCGIDIANQVAKTQVIDSRRSKQNMYVNAKLHRQHKDQLVISTQEYIEQNFDSPININRLAGLMNVTERTLNRRFQKAVSMRPSEYIQAIRIERAKSLLESSSIQLKSLANKVGYADSASFSRLFKRETGLTPKEYYHKFARSNWVI